MSRARGWIAAGVIAIALLAVVLVTQQGSQTDNHSSSSDTSGGTSALLLFAEAMGHPTNQIGGSFATPDPGALMFVFTPTSPFTPQEAANTVTWVRSGGVLVYANEQGDSELDSALGVTRSSDVVGAAQMTSDGPVLAGVNTLVGGPFAQALSLGPDQVAIMRIGPYPIAYIQHLGAGTVVVMADPLPLANGYLDKADNGRFAADLLGLTQDGAPVAFDEYHHGVNASDLTPQAWLLTPWGAATLWLLVAVFFGLVLRGRRFGPLVPRQVAASRAEVEWAVAVGELLRRAGARGVTLGVLAAASERAVAARAGLAALPRDTFWRALWQRAPDVAGELDAAERALYGSTASEKDLLSAAQRLHHIAYPVSEERRRRNPQ